MCALRLTMLDRFLVEKNYLKLQGTCRREVKKNWLLMHTHL